MLKDKAEVVWSKNYKILMSIPIILLFIALVLIGIKFSGTGDLFNKDISLRGGVSATIYTEKEIDESLIANSLGVDSSVKKLQNVRTGRQVGVIVEVSDLSDDKLKSELESILDIKLDNNNYSSEETSAKLSQSFFRQLGLSLLFAFILMAVSVFITFRSFAPGMAVIFAAVTDIVITLAVVNLLGMNISTAGIVAFMLIIGYSIDTDILLTTWSIKRKEGKLFDRMWHSMKTGLTMTLSAIVVMLIGLIISNNMVIKEMFTIIFIALFVDVISTYLTNAGILWIYCRRKNIS